MINKLRDWFCRKVEPDPQMEYSNAEDISKLQNEVEVQRYVIHEFRNILSILYGYSEVMLFNETFKEINEVQTISEMCKRGLTILDQLHYDVQRSTNVSVNLQNTVDLFRILRKNYKIGCWYDKTNTTLNNEQLYLLDQVLINLLLNAIHAVKENHGQIFIEYIETENYFEIHIHDTGFGIPDDCLDNIFDMGWTTKGDAGNGVGLAVSLHLIEQLKGTIYVENKDWTTFTVNVPK